jgi:hypothetical protein
MTDQNRPAEDDDPGQSPNFGRLLVILLLAVALIGVITFASEAYYS